MEAGNLVALNGDYLTYYRSYDQVTSNIDLSLITNSSAVDYDWNILDDLYGSNYYPTILVSSLQPSSPEYTDRYNTSIADWLKYRDLAIATASVAEMPNIDEAYEHLNNN